MAQSGAEQAQGQQHQAQAYQCAADAFKPRIIAQAKDDITCQQSHRHCQRGIKTQQLYHQGRADIGPQHHGQGGRQAQGAGCGKGRGHEADRRTALQYAGNAYAADQCHPAVIQIAPHPVAQLGAKPAQQGRGNHMGAPQQKCDGAREVE
ncbi:MAG: hypothetical protein ACFWUJ_08310 [Pseudomonas fragi]